MDMEKLSRENSGLIYTVARRFLRLCALDRAADLEDLMQAGHIGLWKAAETFDPTSGKSWAGWAAWHISVEMQALTGVRTTRRRADLSAASLNAPLVSGEADGDTLGDMIADESLPDALEGLLRAEARQEMRAAVHRLPDLERAVITGHSLRGISLEALGETLGRPAEDLQRAMWRGIYALRRDKALRAYMLDLETRFYAHKGVTAYNRDWTSTTEAAALWRIEHGEGT